MSTSKVIGLDAYSAELKKRLMEYCVKEQTDRLIAYAKEEIKKLGDTIQTYHSANHMDRTGNLLNSLCWGVTYNGEMKGCGFYRDEQNHSRGLHGGTDSYLHEYFKDGQVHVDGRKLANRFLVSKHGKAGKWTTFFAILADYWGYWESGFTMRTGGGESNSPRNSKFYQFQVMTHIYDDVRMALKPAETHLTVYVPEYSYSSRSKKGKKYKNKIGAKKIGVIR